MAYALYTQSYGVANANAVVRILETSTGMPAIVLSSATGGLVNDRGSATLDASGNLSVYIDTARFWTVYVNDVDKQNVYMDFSPKYVYVGILSGAPAASGYTAGERIIVSDDNFTERTSNGAAWVGSTYAQLTRADGAPEPLGGSRALLSGDNQGVFTQAGSATVTITTLPTVFNGCSIWLTAAGTITVQGTAGVLINGVDGGSATLSTVNRSILIQKVGTNSYNVLS